MIAMTVFVAIASAFPAVTLHYVDAPSAGCVAFRQTGLCSGSSGPREPAGDQPCSAQIDCKIGDCPSGYCDCVGAERVHPVSCVLGSHSAFTCAAVCASVPAPPSPGKVLQLSNGFAQLTLDFLRPSVVSILADFLGASGFDVAHEVLASSNGIRLESVIGDVVKSSADKANPNAVVTIVSNTSEYAKVELSGVVDDVAAPSARETWTLEMRRDERFVTFSTRGATLNAAADAGVAAIRHAMYFNALSVYGFFERGAVQMKDSDAAASFFGARDGLLRAYALGGGSAIDIANRSCVVGASNATQCAHTLLSSGNAGYSSGLHEVLVGEIPTENKWTNGGLARRSGGAAGGATADGGAASSSAASASATTTWATSAELTPNDRNFPAHGLTTGANLPIRDLEALLTGIYASSPGCLATFDNEVKDGERVAQIGTTINRPGRGYAGTYNVRVPVPWRAPPSGVHTQSLTRSLARSLLQYFDPDNFISLSAMIYSGDLYLQHQARDVLMRSGEFLKISSDKFNGELPHHFEGDVPTFLALSGAVQTGPNTFWTKTALQYARNAADMEWVKGYLPKLRNASGFCFGLIDPAVHLLNAPGSLMIGALRSDVPHARVHPSLHFPSRSTPSLRASEHRPSVV